jgi:hypothetical protein
MRTAQKSIISGYNATSTAEEVAKGIDLSGKLAIVTGGYSGIGLGCQRTDSNWALGYKSPVDFERINCHE